mgnify:CR=1 FL=1
MKLINKATAAALPVVPKPVVGYFSQRYIAGSALTDAVEEVRRLNARGMLATIDVLGESIRRIGEAQKPVEEYLKVLDAIREEKLSANISVKPTQLGLMLDYDKCLENYSTLCAKANEFGNFVRIDMEDATTTDATFKLYRDLKEKYADNVGVVVQAYLRRTIDDIVKLTDDLEGVNFRICKGIYVESRKIAWKDRDIIRKNFEWLLKEALTRGAYVGIATHDEWLVWAAMKIIRRMGLSKDKYEFQMLLGVQPELRQIIVDAGHRLRVYVPFGEDWYPYSTRRLRENPEMAGHIMKAMFSPPRR